jgi:hypothetical protein
MMSRFGEVREVLAKTWSTAYRYPVGNIIRIVVITSRTHVPLNIVVTRHRTLVSYEGQPSTCHECDEMGQVYQDCLRRRRGKEVEGADSPLTWTEVALSRRCSQQREQERGLGETDSTRVAKIEKVEDTRDTRHNEGVVNKSTSERR